jgi:5-hydroxyisourate hydrolase-like protein (transthyretin family)
MLTSITVTDVIDGRAAEGIALQLERQVFGNWELVSTAVSNHSGAIFFPTGPNQGKYRLSLDAEAYFALSGVFCHVAKATIVFNIENADRNYVMRLYIGSNSQFWSICGAD